MAKITIVRGSEDRDQKRDQQALVMQDKQDDVEQPG